MSKVAAHRGRMKPHIPKKDPITGPRGKLRLAPTEFERAKIQQARRITYRDSANRPKFVMLGPPRAEVGFDLPRVEATPRRALLMWCLQIYHCP